MSSAAAFGYLRDTVLHYLLRRVAGMLPLVLGTTLIVFVLGRVVVV